MNSSEILDQQLKADLETHTVNIWHLNSKAAFYLKELMPIIMMLACCALGVFLLYNLFMILYYKILSYLYSSITISNKDDTFFWVQKYMQDTGIIKEDTQLKAGLKRKAKEEWWESIKTTMF